MAYINGNKILFSAEVNMTQLNAEVVQETGNSDTAVMSQKAVGGALSDIPEHARSVNMFDRNSPLNKSGYYGYDGVWVESSTYHVSHPIYVRSGNTYKWRFDSNLGSENLALAVVDKENNQTKTVFGVVDGDYLTYTADFTGFISVNTGKLSLGEFMVCLEEEYPDSYVPYLLVSEASVESNKILGQISKEKLEFVREVKSPNLFDNGNVIDGYFQLDTGAVVSSDSCFCAYIPIEHAGTYQLMVAGNIFGVWGMCQIPCFDSENNYVGKLAATTTETAGTAENKATLVVTEANIHDKQIAYIGLSGRKVSIDKAMVVEADEYPSEYFPYYRYWTLSDLKILKEHLEYANPLYGKVITFNGDSICEGAGAIGGYAKYIGERNGMIVENIGVSGGTVAYSANKYAAEPNYYHCISRSINEMREDADYIILEGGVNDLYNSDITLGTLSNGYNAALDDTTFYGAFENMLKQALIRFPGKKIGYIAVHKMTQYFDGDKTEENAYHAAIKCCKKWGVPVLDLNVSCPPFGYLRDNPDTVFIPNTYTAHTAEGVGDGWHPNEDGYLKYYVPKIEAWMKTL